ncbi:uncharacterized protein [Amphiura filiformis]|uniref:uncharacterized protein n=1 Tax=Amphiura filiformis TaxID=82378 RepID=UPI003B218F9C
MTRYRAYRVLLILCSQLEHLSHAHLSCEVTHKDTGHVRQWFLPYEDPCECAIVRFGGWSMDTPGQPLNRVYADTPLVSNDVGRIREHYHLNCIAFTCPISVTFETETDSGQATRLVTWPVTMATGNDGESLSVVCSPPSGSNFPIGITKVECHAEDGRGNRKECIFDIIVEAFTCPISGTFETETDSGQAIRLVTWPVTITSGNDGESLSVVCSPPSGSNFRIGITKVECHAEDGRGYRKECTFDIIVEDMEPPVINSCPTDQELVTYPGKNTAVVIYQTPNATDNADNIQNVVCNPSSESEIAIGLTAVTCEALDSSQNLGFCEFRVNITLGKVTVEEYCSTGWDIINRPWIDGFGYIMVSPDKYVLCNGVITTWSLFPKNPYTLKAIIWRQLSNDLFQIVGINTIEITADEINKPLTYIVPVNDYIEVQAGDMIGWASWNTILPYNDIASNTFVRWFHMSSLYYFNDAVTAGMQQTFLPTDIGVRQYAIHATVRPFEATCDSAAWKLFANNCYLAQNTQSSFHNAETACHSLSGHLTSIHSQSEQKFIRALSVSADRFWIGFTDQHEENTFVWTDDSEVEFTKWHKGEPNNAGSNEDCTIMLPNDDIWVDVSCDRQHSYVCKKPAAMTI